MVHPYSLPKAVIKILTTISSSTQNQPNDEVWRRARRVLVLWPKCRLHSPLPYTVRVRYFFRLRVRYLCCSGLKIGCKTWLQDSSVVGSFIIFLSTVLIPRKVNSTTMFPVNKIVTFPTTTVLEHTFGPIFRLGAAKPAHFACQIVGLYRFTLPVE